MNPTGCSSVFERNSLATDKMHIPQAVLFMGLILSKVLQLNNVRRGL
jgi:hypothetical protein